MKSIFHLITKWFKAFTESSQTAEAYFNRGMSKNYLKDYRGALAEFNKVIDLDPEYAMAYFARGLAKNWLQDYRGANADYSKAIEINPHYAEAFYNRGSNKYNLQDNLGAITDYSRAIEINPKLVEAFINRGISKGMLQDYIGAIADYTKAIEINPNLADAYLNRGIAKAILQDYIGAIADFTKATELDPNNAIAYSYRGQEKGDLQDYIGAIADFSKAIELDPRFAMAYCGRGAAKISSGQKESGCLDLSKARELGFVDAYKLINKYCILAPQGKEPTLVNVSDQAAITNKNLESLKDVQLPIFSSFTDSRDGNVYKTVKIGHQIWMAENLRYIPHVCPVDDNGGIWVYDYNGHNIKEAISTEYYKKFGCLYDWETAKSVCPEGWHLPTDEEWTELTDYLGGEKVAGIKMKSTYGWFINGNGNNESGFTALPGGHHNQGVADFGSWWSFTESKHTYYAWSRTMIFSNTKVYRNSSFKQDGFSVRCVRD